MDVMKITIDNFEEEVMKTTKTVLLDFWADWCGPCRMLSPIVEQVAQEVPDTVKIGKINVDEEMQLATEFEIESIPTLVVIKNGKVINRTVGVQSKEEILNILT